jgi:hypothetical protein
MTDYTDPANTLTPVKAIRAKCLDCTCNQPKEVRLCPVYSCPLWPYRMGHRPTQQLFDEKPPRYVAPPHLPVIDDAGRILSPEERKSRASSGKTPSNGRTEPSAAPPTGRAPVSNEGNPPTVSPEGRENSRARFGKKSEGAT